MPRTNTNTQQTEFYRLLVESFYGNEWHETLMYGPYFNAAAAKSTISGAEKWYKTKYEKGTRRSRVQKQESVFTYIKSGHDQISGSEIIWVDVA